MEHLPHLGCRLSPVVDLFRKTESLSVFVFTVPGWNE